MMEIIRFTKAGGPLTKRIYLAADGGLKSDGSACLMARGHAERVEISCIAQFGALIGGLATDQAIALGTLRADLPDKVAISTKKAMNGHAKPNAVTRTAANIVYRQGPGLALIDFDAKGMPADVGERIDREGGCWPALMSVMPRLGNVASVTRISTSAGLYRRDNGAPIAGSNGIHIYLNVKDAADIERFIRTLHDRCWLAGFGWMMVGVGGQLLERSIVDRMVGAPERLVFEGAPVLDPPLAQDQEARRPDVVEGEALDTIDACPPLTILEKARLREMQAKAAHQLAGESAKARKAFINKHVDLIVERTGMSRTAAKEAVAKQCDGILLPAVVLPFDDADLAGKTVADVLADPERFEGETLADPLEGVEYGACKAKIMLNADGTPWINSFAHGRTVYSIKLDAAAIRAAMAAADVVDVVGVLVERAQLAALGPADEEALITYAKERTGAGMRAIARTLKQARKEQTTADAKAQRDRRAAERRDPRPEIPEPETDAPWIPEMTLYGDVISRSKDRVPPARNFTGESTGMYQIEVTGTHAFTRSEEE